MARQQLTPTAQLADWISRTRFEDLPPDVVHQAWRCIVDCLGVALGATGERSAAIWFTVADTIGGRSQARIWGTPRQTDVATAALVNGHLAHLLDFDDSYVPGVTVLHGTAPVVPAALALAELEGASGRAFLLAFAIGFEVAARVTLAAGARLYGAGWHVTPVTGPVGAAAAGKVLGLDAERLTWALGVGSTQAGGLGQAIGTMTKAFHAGHAAHAGVLAGLLAREGFTSGPDMLAAERGSLLGAFPSDRNLDALLGELGSRWELRRAAFKPYACGVVQHALIDGVLELRATHHLAPDDVEQLTARVHPTVTRVTGRHDPHSGLESKFSAYHSAAVALVDGQAAPPQYTEARAADPHVLALRERIDLQADPGLRIGEAYVRIRLRDGTRLEQVVSHASGTADNPLSDEQLRRKFRALAVPCLGAEQTDRALDALHRLAELGSVAELTALLAPPGGRS